jgi:predicted dehydrogenase
MIGCGDVAERKSGPGFYKARNSELVAVMRRIGALAADYARRHRVPRWHDDASAIIEARDIDAVYIATLTDSHREYTLRCAAAGKPVYVEKPMGEPRAMRRHGRRLRRRRRTALGRLLPPRAAALSRDTRSRRVRRDRRMRMAVTYLAQRLPDASAFEGGQVPWRVNRALSGGGLFFESCCHTFDFLDFLLGPIAEVRGFAANQARRYDAEDVIVGSYRFASGVYGSGTFCYAADTDIEYTELVGATGRLRFSTFAPVPIRILRGDSVEERAIGDPEHVHQPMISRSSTSSMVKVVVRAPADPAPAPRVMDAIWRVSRPGFSHRQPLTSSRSSRR